MLFGNVEFSRAPTLLEVKTVYNFEIVIIWITAAIARVKEHSFIKIDIFETEFLSAARKNSIRVVEIVLLYICTLLFLSF